MAFVYINCSGVRTYSSRNVLYFPLVLVPLAWPRLNHIILVLLSYTSSYPIPSLSPFVVCPEVDPSRDSVLRNLSGWCRRKAREVAETGLWIVAYNNVNTLEKVSEQTVNRKGK